MSKAEYRIVIIGVGGIADTHAQCLVHDVPGASLVAGSCRTESRGRAFSERYGCPWFADYEAMLEEIRPDAAIITTPSGAHLEPALACAERGIHVLSEKPLEITVARTRRMIEAAEAHGVRVGGIFQMRFTPSLQAVHAAAAAGRFGNLAAIAAWVPWWRDDDYYGPGRWQGTRALDGGGALINQGSHVVDTVQWLAHAAMPEVPSEMNPVHSVFAHTARRGHDADRMEVEDTCAATLHFLNGAVGQLLTATSMYPGGSRRLVMGGKDGSIEVEENRLLRYAFRSELPEDDEVRTRLGSAPVDEKASSPLDIDRSGHAANISAFLDACRNGTDPELNGHEALKAVAIVEAIYRSAQSGKPEEVWSN